MTKTKRTEIIEEYDKDGKLIRRTTTEENEEGDSERTDPFRTYPYTPCWNCPYAPTNSIPNTETNIWCDTGTTTIHN